MSATGIPCPNCGHTNQGITDARPSDGRFRRRRECKACGSRFTTYEMTEADLANLRPVAPSELNAIGLRVEDVLKRIRKLEGKAR